jgi:hypothetical protein
LHGDHLKVRLRSPPVDGQANRELLRFLGETLGVPVRDLQLVAGETSRGKVVRASGLDAATLLSRLPPR